MLYCRFDDVEINCNDTINHPAKLRYFIQDLITKKLYALIQWYTLQPNFDDPEDQTEGARPLATYFRPLLRVPRAKLLNPCLRASYKLIHVEEIAGHAHMVPDFDQKEKDENNNEHEFMWWDLVNQESLTY